MNSMGPRKRICYVNDLTEEEKIQVNKVCNSGFPKGGILYSEVKHDFISSMSNSNPLLSLLYIDGIIIGVCFADIEHKRVIKPLSHEYLYLHTIAIDSEHRGKGYCYQLVRNLITGKIRIGSIVKQLGKLPMYLHVCANIENPNESAIKCYKKNGFKFVDMIYINKDDGPNVVMVRDKGIGKGKTKQGKTKQGKTKQGKTKKGKNPKK